jgi:hypothetical protein
MIWKRYVPAYSNITTYERRFFYGQISPAARAANCKSVTLVLPCPLSPPLSQPEVENGHDAESYVPLLFRDIHAEPGSAVSTWGIYISIHLKNEHRGISFFLFRKAGNCISPPVFGGLASLLRQDLGNIV